MGMADVTRPSLETMSLREIGPQLKIAHYCKAF